MRGQGSGVRGQGSGEICSCVDSLLTEFFILFFSIFFPQLTELQGDREELKTRLERLENSPPQSSPSPVHSASPYPPQSYIPSSALSSFPRHVPPHQRMTSPSIPSSHPRPSPSPQYVTPEDWIFSRPSLHE